MFLKYPEILGAAEQQRSTYELSNSWSNKTELLNPNKLSAVDINEVLEWPSWDSKERVLLGKNFIRTLNFKSTQVNLYLDVHE